MLSQYRVDFEPEIDVTQTKKNLLNANKAAIGSRYIFDGASMYLTQKFDPMTIHTTYNNNPMKITIRWTGCVESDDHAAFQLFNLIFREAMEGLKLQNVRRDLYDPAAKVRKLNVIVIFHSNYLFSRSMCHKEIWNFGQVT